MIPRRNAEMKIEFVDEVSGKDQVIASCNISDFWKTFSKICERYCTNEQETEMSIKIAKKSFDKFWCRNRHVTTTSPIFKTRSINKLNCFEIDGWLEDLHEIDLAIDGPVWLPLMRVNKED